MIDNSRDSSLLYVKVKEELKKRIDEGCFRLGELIPSELDLQKEFGVSRITVRRAINDMVNEGYFSRTRGKGTILTMDKISEKLNSIKSFTDEMSNKGLETTSKDVIVQVVGADKNIASALNVNKGDFVLRIERLRLVNDSPLAFFITYLKLSQNIPLTPELYMGSMYEVLKEHCGISISKVNDLFEAIIASDEIYEKLDFPNGSPVFKRERVAYSSNGESVEYTVVFYRGDKYKYSIEMG